MAYTPWILSTWNRNYARNYTFSEVFFFDTKFVSIHHVRYWLKQDGGQNWAASLYFSLILER